jgi:O-acetyl-ADP-ribose deacetylase (regulator of RNase III)
MPFTIVREDITKLKVDAIVNAANTSLRMGGGVCGAIFSAAGADRLQTACNAYARIKTGEVVITQGFNLPAKYIIHTAGPVYRGGNQSEETLLRSCYTKSLELALKHDCESIAFPLISSGIYCYPKDEALRIATATIRDFIGEHDIVSLVVFDKTAFQVSEELLGAVESYIDEFYVEECSRPMMAAEAAFESTMESVTEASRDLGSKVVGQILRAKWTLAACSMDIVPVTVTNPVRRPHCFNKAPVSRIFSPNYRLVEQNAMAQVPNGFHIYTAICFRCFQCTAEIDIIQCL